jgi:hypothetical protein
MMGPRAHGGDGAHRNLPSAHQLAFSTHMLTHVLNRTDFRRHFGSSVAYMPKRALPLLEGPRTVEWIRQHPIAEFSESELRSFQWLRRLAERTILDDSRHSQKVDESRALASGRLGFTVDSPGLRSQADSAACVSVAESALSHQVSSHTDKPLSTLGLDGYIDVGPDTDDEQPHGRDPHCFSDDDRPQTALYG